ncbi:uncharacterized protein LOC132523168 [Lagenorhynchus albirostris]|uniref:uncharacterized protein LOC132523168 n=1 Tax=Lagenorhynchus albirostris TaxID=27610 RepID=UPI0028E26FC4|nr:uncharacterized protein LOC132523168 [Lagenorhynchus albirostris]
MQTDQDSSITRDPAPGPALLRVLSTCRPQGSLLGSPKASRQLRARKQVGHEPPCCPRSPGRKGRYRLLTANSFCPSGNCWKEARSPLRPLLIFIISISWVNIHCNNSQKSARKAVFHVAPAGERTAQPSEPAPGACSRWRVFAQRKSDRLSLRHREDKHASALWEPAGRDGISLQVPRGARPLGGPPPLLTSMRDLPGCLLCAEHLRGHP